MLSQHKGQNYFQEEGTSRKKKGTPREFEFKYFSKKI